MRVAWSNSKVARKRRSTLTPSRPSIFMVVGKERIVTATFSTWCPPICTDLTSISGTFSIWWTEIMSTQRDGLFGSKPSVVAAWGVIAVVAAPNQPVRISGWSDWKVPSLWGHSRTLADQQFEFHVDRSYHNHNAFGDKLSGVKHVENRLGLFLSKAMNGIG